jgi:hypothetical protein
MKRTNKLPDWFDISNYKNTKNFSKADWLRQLRYRSSALIDFDVLRAFDESIYVIDEIRRCGLPSKEWDNLVHSSCDPSGGHAERERIRENRFGYHDLGNSAVFPMPTMLTATICEFLTPDIEKTILSDGWEYESLMSKEPFDIHASRNEAYEFDGRAFIMLDMNLPDTEIIECFKEFLPKYRKALGIKPIKKRPTETTLYSCQKYKILAYLDLLIWELENNTQIKRSVIAISLYPDGLIGDIGITQTIHPFALEVTSEAFLKSLERISNK